MAKKHKIKVVLGAHIKREAVLINQDGAVLDSGTTSAQITKKRYGRR